MKPIAPTGGGRWVYGVYKPIVILWKVLMPSDYPQSSSLEVARSAWWSPRELSPSYFAFVMATGILSVDLQLQQYTTTSIVLLVIGAIGYVVLIGLNIWRLIAHWDAVLADFADVRQAFGFFTFVAASGVLGSRLVLSDRPSTAVGLLIIAAIVWLILGYLIPLVTLLGKAERPIYKGANGNWFIWVVGAQSVAVLAASLEPKLNGARVGLSTTAVFAWSLGVMLYIAIAVFVVLRMMTYPLDPQEFKPPYWVSMGALAISVLAGSHIAQMTSSPIVDLTGKLITGVAVVLWCVATWMIPALFGIGIWRHFIRKVPLVYEPSLWSLVFPLGMYSAASGYLGQANDLTIIQNIGSGWLWVAVAAWVITFIAMLGNLILRIRQRG